MTPDGPPATETERLLLGIWREAFADDDLTVTDDFFALGGDSLTAAAIAAGIETAFGRQVAFRIFFDHPTIASLANALDAPAAPEPNEGEPPATVAQPQRTPISFLQREFWRTFRNPRGARRYAFAAVLAIDGALDRDALHRALRDAVERQENLRARFEDDNGEAVQIVEPPFTPELPVVDLTASDTPDDALAALVAAAAGRTYDLTRLPLFAFTLARTAADHHKLVMSVHHMIFDGMSFNVLLADVAHAYASRIDGTEPTPPPPAQYADFVRRHRREWTKDGATFRAAVDWWKEQAPDGSALPDAGSLRSLWRKRPVDVSDFGASVFVRSVDEEVSARLDALSRERSTTDFCVRTAAVAAVMAQAARSDRIMIGMIVNLRRHASLNHVFGPFTQAAPLLVHCDRRAGFSSLIDQIRDRMFETRAFAEAPVSEVFAQLRDEGVEVRHLPVITRTTSPAPTIRAAGVAFRRERVSNDAPFTGAIWANFTRHDRPETCELSFDRRIYDPDAMGALVDKLLRFLGDAANAPDRPLEELLASD